jgi:hypothetical protein
MSLCARFRHELGVDHREKRGVESRLVLDHDDHRHARLARVVSEVAAVLDILDDGQQDPDVALPQEDALQLGRVVTRNEVLELARIVGQQDDGRIQPGLPQPADQLEDVHVPEVEAGDDEIVPLLFSGERQRPFTGRDVRELRGVPQIEIEELGEDQLAEVAVLGQDEEVVQARDQQDVLHVKGHQLLKPDLPAAVVSLGSLSRTGWVHRLSRQRRVAAERDRLLSTATFY